MTLLGINMVFMITAILLVTVGYFLQMINIHIGLIVTEFIIILGPAVVYVLRKKAGIADTFRIRKVNPKTLALCAAITLFAYPVGLFVNLLSNLFISMFGQLLPMPIPIAGNGREYVQNLLVIALTAGIAEELFFRGLLMKGYERFGPQKAIIVTSLLFGIFHFNIQNFVGPVFLGLLFGYMTIKTGSIFPAVTGHFIYNAISVTFAFAANTVYGATAAGVEEAVTMPVLLAGAAVWGGIALVSGFIMMRLLRRLGRAAAVDVQGEQGEHAFLWRDSLPLLVTLLIFIILGIKEFSLIINGIQ